MKLPELTKKQKELKTKIENLEKLRREIQGKINKAKNDCSKLGHVIVPYDLEIDEKLKTDKWASSGAYCLVCRDFGEGLNLRWWCPKSPDHRCHTDSNGICTYCGMPDERK